MNEIDGCNSCVGDALRYTEVGELRAKAEYVMKIGILLDSGDMSKPEGARKLGLSMDELNEFLSGQVRDLAFAKIAQYQIAPPDETG